MMKNIHSLAYEDMYVKWEKQVSEEQTRTYLYEKEREKEAFLEDWPLAMRLGLFIYFFSLSCSLSVISHFSMMDLDFKLAE